jgi:hypothetical protein
MPLFHRDYPLQPIDIEKPTRLLQFVVKGRAVPWSVPNIRTSKGKEGPEGNWIPGKPHTKKNRPLAGWQQIVNFEARRAWGFRSAYEGVVGISTWFYIRKAGWQKSTPDLTNLLKGLEDALQASQKAVSKALVTIEATKQMGIILNDTQVFASHNERLFIGEDDEEKAYCEVWAMPDSLVSMGPEPPGPYTYRPWLWCEEADAERLAAG